MLIEVLVLFCVALVCLILGMLIRSGNTDLIHEYHRKNVTDFKGYAREMGKCIMGLSAINLISGLIVLIFKTREAVIASIIFYIIAFIIFFICVYRVQKKYNGSFFS